MTLHDATEAVKAERRLLSTTAELRSHTSSKQWSKTNSVQPREIEQQKQEASLVKHQLAEALRTVAEKQELWRG